MKTGIIVFSHTGHTLEVSKKTANKINSSGNLAEIKEISVEGGYDPEKGYDNFKLETIPGCDTFDNLIFCAPVMAFSLCPVMKVYLKQLSSLEGKRASLIITQHLKFKWMGGNRAIRQMKRILASKGCQIKKTGIIHWSSQNRDSQIETVVNAIAGEHNSQ